MLNIKNEFLNSNIKNDILSGLVVAIVLIPETIVFAVIAGISPIVGLYTACILGMIVAIIGGKSGVISGLTGAIAVILLSLSIKIKENLPAYMIEELSQNGEFSVMILQYILLATLLAGIIQVLFGLFKIAKYIRLVPSYVLFGLVNGLAIITFVSQFYTFKAESYLYAILVATTILIIFLLPKFTKIIPSSFVALVLISSIVLYFDLDTKKIGDLTSISSSLPVFSIPKIHINFEAILIVLPYSLLIAFISSLESLLTINLLDEMDEKKGNDNQECIALGAGNIACGFLGAPAGSSMLSQSVLNYSNGAFSRISTLLVPIFIMLFILYCAEFVEHIPLAVLVGILACIPIFLFQWQNTYRIKKFTTLEKIVIVLVSAITIVAHLEVAFVLALLIAFVLYTLKLLTVTSKVFMQDETKVYELYGPLHQFGTTSFIKLFDTKHDPKTVILNFKNVRVVDIKALQAIEKVVEQYRQENTLLRIKHLSHDCKKNLKESLYYCEYNEDDPTYKVAID